MDRKTFFNVYVRNILFPGGAYYIPRTIILAWYRTIDKDIKNCILPLSWPSEMERMQLPERPTYLPDFEKKRHQRSPRLTNEMPFKSFEEYFNSIKHNFTEVTIHSEGFFLREILFPVIGLANLNKVQLQYPILGENGVLYHSDFMISIGGSQFAIEIESAIHREKSVHIKDTERQNALIATGFTVLRYVTSEFQQNTQKVQDQLKIDLRLNQKSDSDTILNAEELFLLFFEREFGNACGRFTEFLLELYIHNDLENTKIHILDYSLSYCLLTMIEHDIRTVIEHAMKIWNVNLFIPELIIDTIAMTSDRALFESCWKEYTEIIWHHQNSLYACADIITKPTIINSDKPQDPIKSMFSVNYDVILLDQPLESFTNGVEFYQFIYKLFKITATDGRLEVLQSREEGRNIDVTNPQWHRLSNLERPSYISESIALFYLFRWFSHQAFRDGQYAIIEKALLKGSVLGVLPTGAGKSVCFQIPALLIPGISLVVSPLKSLMLDQHRILKERHKLLCVSRIASDVTPSEQKRTIEKVLDGEIKLLYVAPERLQMVEFKKNLESIMSRISLLILDEVHCLSEWGHDFRPSYLSVRDLIESNTRSFGLIALTATAPKLTREDICTQLNLDIETDTVNASTLDRVNLSFEVRKFNNQEEKIGWATVFLDKNGNNVFLKTHPNIRLKDASGIFFSLYGTASGKKTSQLNVKNIKKKMEGKNYTIDYYCGEDKGEQVCPYCKHNEVIYHAGHNGAYNEYKCHVCQKLYSSDKSKLDCLPVSAMESNGKWMCVDCKTQFKSENYKKGIKNHYTCSNCNKNWTDSPGYKNKSWDIEKGRIQKEFTEGKIHRIAATKSFGMGIDKPDIRYVIHIIPPISLGAYYQEAGRAGRDEKHSHNIMLFVAPSIVCSEELFRGTLKLPICFKLKSLEKGGVYYQGCPYRSDYNDVCDVYHMFQFILDKDVVNVAQETCINGNEQIELIQYKKAWIDKETKELNHFYSVHFINKVNMAEIVVPFADNNSKILQSNLVLFRSIGLISKYTIDYSAKSCRFTKPVFNAGNKKHVFDKTDIYLRSGKTGLALPRDISESDTFQSKAFSLIAESHYRIGVETRINALMNMFRLYIDADNKCRKAAMVSFLEDMQLTEGERCENCDVCRPKLDFPETANRLVRADASSRNTAKMLNDTVEELLKKYDVSEMIKFIERTHENVHLKFIRARLSQSIEELPTPSAYFILCEVERKLTGATSKTGLDRILETIPTNMSSESACCLIEWTEQNFKGYEFETASIICFCNPDVQEKKDFVQIFLRVAPAHHKRKLLLFNLVNRHKMLNEGINHGKN